MVREAPKTTNSKQVMHCAVDAGNAGSNPAWQILRNSSNKCVPEKKFVRTPNMGD